MVRSVTWDLPEQVKNNQCVNPAAGNGGQKMNQYSWFTVYVNTMLDDAVKKLSPGERPIVHSDRGAHYRWTGWIERMDKAGLTRSMSRKGCSPDNAACEGVFGRLKNEMFYNTDWLGISISKFIDILNDYLIWYNETRIKKSLGYMSPMEYRRSLGLIA